MKIGKSAYVFSRTEVNHFFNSQHNVNLQTRLTLFRGLFMQVYVNIFQPLNNNLYENR